MLISGKELNKALGVFSQVVDNKASMPILNCVSIKCNGDVARLCVTDLNVDVTTEIVYKGAPFQGALNLKDLKSAVKGAKGPIEITEQNDEMARVSADGVTTDMDLYLLSDYPEIRLPTGERKIQYGLHEALKYVSSAMSTDESREETSAVYCDKDGTIVATDGHRLHMSTVEQGVTWHIRRRAIIAVLKAWDKGQEIAVSANDGALYCNGFVIVSKSIEHRFPPYKNIIPKNKYEMRISFVATKEIVKTIKSMDLVYKKKNYKGKVETLHSALRIEVKWGEVYLSSDTPDGQRVEARLDCEVDGAYLTFGVNPKYLIDAMKVGEYISIAIFDDKYSPVGVTCGDNVAYIGRMRL